MFHSDCRNIKRLIVLKLLKLLIHGYGRFLYCVHFFLYFVAQKILNNGLPHLNIKRFANCLLNLIWSWLIFLCLNLLLVYHRRSIDWLWSFFLRYWNTISWIKCNMLYLGLKHVLCESSDIYFLFFGWLSWILDWDIYSISVHVVAPSRKVRLFCFLIDLRG